MSNFELPMLKGQKNTQKVPLVIKVGLVIMGIIFVLSLFTLTYKKEYKVNYTEASNIDYKVYLKDNDYFTEDYLGMDNEYISSLIDKVVSDLSYSFSVEDKLDILYDYKVIASLQVVNQNGKKIYGNDEVLTEKSGLTIDNDSNIFSINENVSINYGKYNKKASEFIDTYKLSGVSALLTVKLDVAVNGKHENYIKNAKNKSVISLNIPLATDLANIEINYDLSNDSDVILQVQETLISNKAMFVLLVVFAVIDFVSMIALIVYIISTRDPHAKYEVALEKIIRDYSDYICETNITEYKSDMEKTRSFRLLSIKTFEGLIDAADKLKKPILYHEEVAGESTIFYIYDMKVCYMYTMSVNDFKKNK